MADDKKMPTGKPVELTDEQVEEAAGGARADPYKNFGFKIETPPTRAP